MQPSIHASVTQFWSSGLRTVTLFAMGFCVVTSLRADSELVTPHAPQPVRTERMGGVDVPSVEQLQKMHRSSYILQARDGKLNQVRVEKSLLPPDPGSVQAVSAVRAPDGTVYVQREKQIMKSTDGGRTWTEYERSEEVQPSRFEILNDGTFVTVVGSGDQDKPFTVLSSSDEGRTWQRVTEFDIPSDYKPFLGKYINGVHRLPDETLLCPVDVRMPQSDPELAKWYGEKWTANCFRSTDGGRTWQPPSRVCHWWAGVEGGIYYLDYSAAPGSYNASVVQEDDVILTIVGSTKPGQGPWDPADMTAIRWKPVT